MMSRKKTIPLLHDHHNHPSQYAAFFHSADLSDVKEKGEAISVIEENTSQEEVNVVLGWNNSYYTFTEKDLEKFPPVIICNLSFHGFLSNDKAEEMVKESYENSEILERMKDPVWMEHNLPTIMNFLIEIENLDQEKLESLYDFYLERGIWEVEDMLVPNGKAIEAFTKSGYIERTDLWTDLPTYEKMSDETKEKIKGIKIFTDGALGPKTAAVKESYSLGNKGVLLHDEKSLSELLHRIDKSMISIHAIGNRAIETVVNTISGFQEEGIDLPKIRIEHAQFIDEETAKKAKHLGITLSMQPNFNLDSDHYTDRLSEKYMKMNNPFRMLIDKAGFVPGKDLIFGSDGMPHGVEAALRSSLFPPYPSQRLTLEEFKKGYCISDKNTGSISINIDKDKEEISVERIRAD